MLTIRNRSDMFFIKLDWTPCSDNIVILITIILWVIIGECNNEYVFTTIQNRGGDNKNNNKLIYT